MFDKANYQINNFVKDSKNFINSFDGFNKNFDLFNEFIINFEKKFINNNYYLIILSLILNLSQKYRHYLDFNLCFKFKLKNFHLHLLLNYFK